MLYEFARTAIVKYHRLDGFNNRIVFAHSSGSGFAHKSEFKVSAEFSSEGHEGRTCSRPLSLANRWPSSPYAFMQSSF